MASSSKTVDDFAKQGNWGTVASTLMGGVAGGADGYSMSKSQNRHYNPHKTKTPTGRTEPNNLIEQLSMEQVKSNPSAGTQLNSINLTDPRWPTSQGWVKMQQIVHTSQGDINIHYVYNSVIKIYDDFKFKS